MLDVAKSMAGLPSATGRWANAPAQLVSSRLEQGPRLLSTPSGSIDSSASFSRWPESSLRFPTNSNAISDPDSRLQRADSTMSTATISSGVLASATIAQASTATIRKVERNNASARPIRITRSRKDADDITPSSSVEHMSSRSTGATEFPSSSLFAGDHTQSTITTSFDTTLRSPSDKFSHSTSKSGGAAVPSAHDAISVEVVEPASFFSDTFSGDGSTRSVSASASRLANPDSLRVGPAWRRGSEQTTSDTGASEHHISEMSHSSSYQSAISSIAHPTDLMAQGSRATHFASSSASDGVKSAAAAKYGLGIQTRDSSTSSHNHALLDPSLGTARLLSQPSLEAVPEARESPYMGSHASQATATPDVGTPMALSVSTSLARNKEPVWAESSFAISDSASAPARGPMSTFSFPSPVPTSAGFNSTSGRSGLLSSLSAKYPRSPGSAFHSSNPSIQSHVSNANRRLGASSKTNDGGLLQASSWSHAPPSSYGGSIISSTGATSVMGLSSLHPSTRDDMLHQLLLDQARVDCQEYGTMSLEQVAESKRELKHVERKVQTLRTKLKVEIKIRDAAVALRRAHRRTAASAHSPTSSVNLAVSPTSPRFATSHAATTNATSSSASSSSFAARSRALSISASEAKAEEDVSVSTAKVDKVANELFKWTERADWLRRKLLEHQAATLSERVHHLESDRQVMEEKLPFLTASASFESLAPSASASAVGISRYRDVGRHYKQSADEPYMPRGPDDPLRHNRLESDLSAISGFSFLDTAAPDKLRRLGEELERKRDTIRKLELELDSARDAAHRRDETSDRLTQQLEEQSRERVRAVDELRVLREQIDRHDESARLTQAQAVQAAIVDAKQRMQRQLEQSHSRDQEKEDALVNAKAEVMAGQRALNEFQTRLDALQQETKALRARAETAEKAVEHHKRDLKDMHSESTRQLHQGSQDLASLQAEISTVKASRMAADTLAAERARSIAEQEELIRQLRDELSAEKEARTQAKTQITEAEKMAVDNASRASEADTKLRELELAVGAERRIMAERDELFHAFERRLESAEQRLQEQDKRCARMLGKLEGREEMDDLLERIKAGASGVAKKKKTAGQDIAALLSSLETHIGDLELELGRTTAQTFESCRDSTAASDALAPSQHVAKLEASTQEAQRWKDEAERLKTLLATHDAQQSASSTADQQRMRELEDQVRAVTEQGDRFKRQAEQQVIQLETEVRTLSERTKDLERQRVEAVKQLEAKIESLGSQNRELEKQIRSGSSPSSPAASIVSLPPRTSKSASPLTLTFPPQNKGVGNLIDRFGGGRKVASELRADESSAMLQACIRSAENLRAMLPDLPAAAQGSAGLHALREAFQACEISTSSPTAARSLQPIRTSLGAAELQSELDATAERLRSTLAISRAVIDLALESKASKEEHDDAERQEQMEKPDPAEDNGQSSQQALVTRITSLTAKVKEQAAREKRLRTELAEAKEQLEQARNTDRAPSSPYGLTLGSDSMLGLSTSPAKGGESNLFGLPRDLGRTNSNKSMRTVLGEKPNSSSAAMYIPSSAMLAPPRSPSGIDMMPSPTRFNISVHSSPSIRYISPYAAPGFDTRSQQRSMLELSSVGADSSNGDVSRSESQNMVTISDSMSLRSGSSPSSTHLGLPSSAASLTGTSHSSMSTQRGGAEALNAVDTASNGTIKRTITLGMDVPQLVKRVRDLERQLSQTATIRQRAERVADLEMQLREANQAFSKLLDRMDNERDIGTHQKVEILNELNDAQSRLQTTQARMQRAQSHSPFASPFLAEKPLPPPKD